MLYFLTLITILIDIYLLKIMKLTLGYNTFNNVYKNIRSPIPKGHHFQKLCSEKVSCEYVFRKLPSGQYMEEQ